ncbi:lysozyme inhibitor LprI family protein [Rahnella sp. AA]|uniref:lysozyme inhibitor LprI family protein n=1 Tax=Rahnella sp. AA TaxID=2057180 RepID=UPI0012FE93A3|nr:lysozyme inhibitor LprI family protein [Rahnella sp. AA]
MRKTIIAILLLGSTASTAALAKNDFGKDLDDQLADCTNKAESTLASIDCYNTGLKAWDAQLNKQYKLLLAEQPAEFQASLKKSQIAWINYRDSYLEAMQNFYRQQSGTIWGITMSEAKLRVTRDKAIELYKLRTSVDMEG